MSETASAGDAGRGRPGIGPGKDECASTSRLCETASPSTLTVLRLSTSSNLVGGSTGNSFPPALPPAASAPASAPTAAEQAKDKQQHDRAYECIYNQRNDTDPKVNT